MPAVPQLPVVVNGVYPTSSVSALVAAVNFLMQKPRALLVANASLSIPNAAATAIQFAAEVVDTDPDGVGGHDNVTNNTRWTCRYPGLHFITGASGWTGNATGVRAAWPAVNGVLLNNATSTQAANAAITSVAARGHLVQLSTNDYVEMNAYQTSGGALNTTNNAPDECSFMIFWVGM